MAAIQNNRSVSWGLQNTDTETLIEAFQNSDLADTITGNTARVIINSGKVPDAVAQDFARSMVTNLSRATSPETFQVIEADLRDKFNALSPKIRSQLQETFMHSSGKSAKEMGDYLLTEHKGPHIKSLDYGAGDGSVGKIIAKKTGNQVIGADIMPPQDTKIEVVKINPDKALPWKKNEFDIGFIVNLLHHMPEKNQEKVLQELARVIKSGLYVVETTINNTEGSREKTLASDYFSNRILRNAAFDSKDIPVPGTFKTPEAWIETFNNHGLEVRKSETSAGEDRKNMSVPHSRFALGKLD
jgi:2-polyprenyl-3-methyl-5-hydroxy-6-metoxy-1,4-benzoquinol methylase